MRVVTLVLLISCAAVAGDAPGKFYSNEKWGYKLRAPEGWGEVAVADTGFLASKHLGKRQLEGRLKQGDYMTMEAPEMQVLGFPHAKGDTTNPHKSYRDYITRATDFIDFKQGYEIETEKETVVGGTKVTMYELRLGKKRRVGRRVVAWVFHYDDIDFAVQFKILEWVYSDYDKTFQGCLKSFKRIERKKALGGAAANLAVQSRADLLKVPEEKRTRAFKDAVEAKFRAEINALSDGWRHTRTKNFLVLTNADKKFVKGTITHADAVLAHLDKTFGASGREYVPPFILRIYASQDEHTASGKDNKDEGSLVRDIAIYSGKGYVKDSADELLNKALWQRWVRERDEDLHWALPGWLGVGMTKYAEMIRTKGRKVGFANDNWDRDEIRLQIKRDAYETLHTVLSRGVLADPMSKLETGDRERQERVVVLWLLRKGNRGRQKNLVPQFVSNLIEAIEQTRKDWLAKNPKATSAPAVSEIASVLDIRRAAWGRSFSEWTEKNWKKLTTDWLNASK